MNEEEEFARRYEAEQAAEFAARYEAEQAAANSPATAYGDLHEVFNQNVASDGAMIDPRNMGDALAGAYQTLKQAGVEVPEPYDPRGISERDIGFGFTPRGTGKEVAGFGGEVLGGAAVGGTGAAIGGIPGAITGGVLGSAGGRAVGEAGVEALSDVADRVTGTGRFRNLGLGEATGQLATDVAGAAGEGALKGAYGGLLSEGVGLGVRAGFTGGAKALNAFGLEMPEAATRFMSGYGGRRDYSKGPKNYDEALGSKFIESPSATMKSFPEKKQFNFQQRFKRDLLQIKPEQYGKETNIPKVLDELTNDKFFAGAATPEHLYARLGSDLGDEAFEDGIVRSVQGRLLSERENVFQQLVQKEPDFTKTKYLLGGDDAWVGRVTKIINDDAATKDPSGGIAGELVGFLQPKPSGLVDPTGKALPSTLSDVGSELEQISNAKQAMQHFARPAYAGAEVSPESIARASAARKAAAYLRQVEEKLATGIDSDLGKEYLRINTQIANRKIIADNIPNLMQRVDLDTAGKFGPNGDAVQEALTGNVASAQSTKLARAQRGLYKMLGLSEGTADEQLQAAQMFDAQRLGPEFGPPTPRISTVYSPFWSTAARGGEVLKDTFKSFRGASSPRVFLQNADALYTGLSKAGVNYEELKYLLAAKDGNQVRQELVNLMQSNDKAREALKDSGIISDDEKPMAASRVADRINSGEISTNEAYRQSKRVMSGFAPD